LIKPEVTRGAVERTFGRYQLLEPLTKGGMAEVWRAKLVGAESFERPMVIKRILPHLCDDPAFVRMFITEARLSARLHHPNIVQVFELGDVDGELFMALELVNGADLATLLNCAQAPLPLGLCALVAHEICRALSYAHGVTDELGKPLAIVHRDVSPSNVMIGYDGQVRLLDFGIAKALGAATDQRSRTGSIKGKMSYMAPEVFDGAPFDHRSDLFAVGVLLYEMLTGRRLFRAEDELQTMALVRACQVTPPSRFNGDITPELEAVTMRALARNPRDRYPHADDMMADISPLLHDLRWGARETMEVLQRLVPADSLAEPTATKSAWVARGSSNSAATSLTPAASARPVWPLVAIALLTIALAASVTLAFTRSRAAHNSASTSPAVARSTTVAAPPLGTPLTADSPPSAAKPLATPRPPAVAVEAPVAPASPTAPASGSTGKKKKPSHHHSLDLERGDVLDTL
jgi:serine/threonine protein kinase